MNALVYQTFNRLDAAGIRQALAEEQQRHDLLQLTDAAVPGTGGGCDQDDPQWVDMFLQCFIHPHSSSPSATTTTTGSEQEAAEHEAMDDLLFFVRHPHPSNIRDPPVFVRRRTNDGQVPELDDLVAWRRTFFLNCIAQLSFDMTLSVCERRSVGVEYVDFPLDKSRLTSTSSSQTKSVDTREGGGATKKAMVPLRSSTKRVYASPNKSRMDKKSSAGSELAYPHIHFAIDDFEEAFDNCVVQSGQYLCVELSCDIPCPPSADDDQTGTSGRGDVVHVTLFQGAVPFQVLLDTYTSKQSAISPFKALARFSRSFASAATSTPSGSVGGGDDDDANRQFVMMRGPGGKGHAQVAIQPASYKIAASKSLVSITSSTMSLRDSVDNNSSSSSLGAGGEGSAGGTAAPAADLTPPLMQSFRRLSTQVMTSFRPSEEERIPVEFGLACFMTYIHLPWFVIVGDIADKVIEHAEVTKKKKEETNNEDAVI